MGTVDYQMDCPECGGKDTLNVSSHTRLPWCNCGTCVKCGWYWQRETGILPKDELEAIQKDYEFDPKTGKFKE